MLLLALGLVTIVVLVVTNRGTEPHKTSIQQLQADLERNAVEELVVVGGNRVEGKYRGEHGHPSDTFVIPYTGPVQSNQLTPAVLERWALLMAQNKAKPLEARDDSGDFGKQLLTFLPWVFLLGVMWFLVARQMRQMGGGGVVQFGRSKARMHLKERSTVTFADVAGIEEAKEEVQ